MILKNVLMSFEEVCKELNLENTPDWGIINSDSSRVSEFIRFVLRNNLHSSIQFEFVELIIASMNDAIIENVTDCELYADFRKYIHLISENEKFYPRIQYWISIKSEDEYPVGYLLEKYKLKDQEEIT